MSFRVRCGAVISLRHPTPFHYARSPTQPPTQLASLRIAPGEWLKVLRQPLHLFVSALACALAGKAMRGHTRPGSLAALAYGEADVVEQ